MEAPVADLDELTRRQDAIQSLLHDESSRMHFRSLLSQVWSGFDPCIVWGVMPLQQSCDPVHPAFLHAFAIDL